MRQYKLEQVLLRYLERVPYILFAAGGESIEELQISERDDGDAELYASMHFPDGSRLEIHLVTYLRGNTPLLRRYSFHFMDSTDTTIFRYDNARHHYDLEYFPHHKHEGADERVIGCPQPSVGQIRDEIAERLENQRKL